MPEGCPFCEIISGTLPARKIEEDEDTLAFLDINPRNPGHTLVVTKVHYQTLLDVPEKESLKLFQMVKKAAAAVMVGMKANGVSVVQSNGYAAGQLVPHIHFHIIPRFSNEAPMGLEGILQVKKLSEEMMAQIEKNIKGSIGKKPHIPKEDIHEDKPLIDDEEEEFNFDF